MGLFLAIAIFAQEPAKKPVPKETVAKEVSLELTSAEKLDLSQIQSAMTEADLIVERKIKDVMTSLLSDREYIQAKYRSNVQGDRMNLKVREVLKNHQCPECTLSIDTLVLNKPASNQKKK